MSNGDYFGKGPLYIIISTDGKEFQTDEKQEFMPYLKADQIERINVLKDKATVEKYGEDATHGVVEITLKKGALETLPKMIQDKFK